MRASESESEQKAKEYFTHYFRIIAKGAGIKWSEDNDAEIEAAVENVIDAAVERISLARRQAALESAISSPPLAKREVDHE